MNTNPFRYTLDVAVSAEVRAQAARLKVSVRSLSKKTGIAATTLTNKANAASAFSVGEAGAVADALGLSASELVARAEAAVGAPTAPLTPTALAAPSEEVA